QELAIRFPHRVRGLVLVATASSGPLAAPAPIAGLARATAAIVADSVRRRRLWLGRALFSTEFAGRSDSDPVISSVVRDPPPPWALFGQLMAFTTHDRDRDLGRIRAPTLVLHGDRDLLVSVANTHRLTAGIHEAELRVIAGAGHGCMLEQREVVVEAICEWLDRHAPIAPGPEPTGLGVLTERITRKAAVPLGTLRVQRNSLALAYRAITSL